MLMTQFVSHQIDSSALSVRSRAAQNGQGPSSVLYALTALSFNYKFDSLIYNQKHFYKRHFLLHSLSFLHTCILTQALGSVESSPHRQAFMTCQMYVHNINCFIMVIEILHIMTGFYKDT